MLATFDCRLPVKLLQRDDYESTLPGFLDLSSGRFVSDPAAKMINVAPPGMDDWRTLASPVLRGNAAMWYSSPARRWLPAWWDTVAPDGLHYAYVGAAGTSGPPSWIRGEDVDVHVVDVQGPTDRAISTGRGWWILGYPSDGIYVTEAKYSGESLTGLWKIDPTTGLSRQLLPNGVGSLRFGGGAAWGGDPQMKSTILYRYDLTSGTRESWYTRPDGYVTYAGSDESDRPLIYVMPQNGPGGEIWVLSGPNKGTRIHSWSDGYIEVADGDSHGTWMYGSDGLRVLQPNGQLIHVTTAQVQPLGACQ